jgi:hypothetical protein
MHGPSDFRLRKSDSIFEFLLTPENEKLHPQLIGNLVFKIHCCCEMVSEVFRLIQFELVDEVNKLSHVFGRFKRQNS